MAGVPDAHLRRACSSASRGSRVGFLRRRAPDLSQPLHRCVRLARARTPGPARLQRSRRRPPSVARPGTGRAPPAPGAVPACGHPGDPPRLRPPAAARRVRCGPRSGRGRPTADLGRAEPAPTGRSAADGAVLRDVPPQQGHRRAARARSSRCAARRTRPFSSPGAAFPRSKRRSRPRPRATTGSPCEVGYATAERKGELYASADLVVLPYTTFASQSAVLQDAYAHRVPLVVSDVGALGETVRGDHTGWVVAPGECRRARADAPRCGQRRGGPQGCGGRDGSRRR